MQHVSMFRQLTYELRVVETAPRQPLYEIPLPVRWKRIEETVYRTVLFGAGGLRMSEPVVEPLMCLRTRF